MIKKRKCYCVFLQKVMKTVFKKNNNNYKKIIIKKLKK